ncbi:MAG: N-acetyltransferase [Anaerolineae bacterium]|nr:MAG: N-acetyltransferase [Anaerolineae bacterium]
MANKPLTLRPYTPADQPACLAIFESNTPKYFHPTERLDFEQFLEKLPCPFFVVEMQEQIVGCGGYGTKPEGIIVLVWGMVHRNLHRQGIGTFLLQERIKIILQKTLATRVIVHTSQHSQDFFIRFGFRQTDFKPNYYAPGLHCVEMELALHSE